MSIVKLNNNGVKNATAFGSISSLGSLTFIKKLTASSSATLSFVDGSSGVVLDNTYKEYLFTFKNMHPATQSGFLFNASIDSGSNYNVAKTTTAFNAAHNPDSGGTNLGYESTYDLANGTGFQILDQDSQGTDNDNSLAGILHLFNPSSSVFVKHFLCQTINKSGNVWVNNTFTAGYINSTSPVDAVQFKFGSGNIDAGDICLYGIA